MKRLRAALDFGGGDALGGIGLAVSRRAGAQQHGVVVAAGGAGQVEQDGSIEGVGFVESQQDSGGCRPSSRSTGRNATTCRWWWGWANWGHAAAMKGDAGIKRGPEATLCTTVVADDDVPGVGQFLTEPFDRVVQGGGSAAPTPMRKGRPTGRSSTLAVSSRLYSASCRQVVDSSWSPLPGRRGVVRTGR